MSLVTKRAYEPDTLKRRTKPKATGRKAPFTIKGWRYRVIWKREDTRPKSKQFNQYPKALKCFRLFGPAPWRYFGGRDDTDPDSRWNCRECDSTGEIVQNGGRWACPKCFGGLTVREFIERRRAQLGKIEWVRIERCPVGPWTELEDVAWEKDGETSGATSNPPEQSAGRFLAEALRQAEDTFALPMPETRPERMLESEEMKQQRAGRELMREWKAIVDRQLENLPRYGPLVERDDLGNPIPPDLGEIDRSDEQEL